MNTDLRRLKSKITSAALPIFADMKRASSAMKPVSGCTIYSAFIVDVLRNSALIRVYSFCPGISSGGRFKRLINNLIQTPIKATHSDSRIQYCLLQ